MKLLIPLLLFPLLIFCQQVESRYVSIGPIASKNISGAYLERVWVADNNWFGSVGVEVMAAQKQQPFFPLTASLGYSLGLPFLSGGFGAGLNTAGKSGAFTEAGAGVKLGIIQAAIQYRYVVMPASGERDRPDFSGVFVRVGVVF